MALTASRPFSPPLLCGGSAYRRRSCRCDFRAVAASDTSTGEEPATRERRKPRVDTRIHWSNPDEGWIGGKKSKTEADVQDKKDEYVGGKFADLISRSTESHYQFLGVLPKADTEEIKAAYRRLSKEYHPDTTTLPLKTASEKFIRLREAYNVLSNDGSRRFYDWTLAQEAESRRMQQMRAKLEDPYMQDLRNWESVPDTVDRLGGKNMKLSDQAMTALTIDVAIILFSICCIIYVVVFEEPY
ncbi:NAD(P)H-quinone oxidoreductase subunit T, chloroplastic [Ananas comosus]|uniref:NAD(P)H-quinone oxidoreductase subunit T, chloroplastic n=1 Tax=Ananas comosus TaxID=4615 RepID=A0A6P5H1M9_ANACO|nr:NAD(P)H-quinone oxidoreductase subunit T, chloroplastic [Ananas comosus]